jgi:hypothetical protein
MNIYLIASIHGRKKYNANYEKLVELVEAAGHKIVSDHVLKLTPAQMDEQDDKQKKKLDKGISDNIKKADAIFAELSHSSTGSGFDMAMAVNQGKPVVIFFSGDEETHLFKILEVSNDKVVIVRYKHLDELKQEVPLMLDFVSDAQDTRFNFFVSPNISSYLDWVSKHRRIPRSVYLRKLIDKDMKTNREFAAAR